MNSIKLLGRLTRDPELMYSKGNTSTEIVRITLAVDKQLSRDKKEEFESKNIPTADFINVVIWGKLALNVAKYTSKGNRILICGRVQSGSYKNKDGQLVYKTDIIAENVEFIDWKDSTNNIQDFPEYTSQY